MLLTRSKREGAWNQEWRNPEVVVMAPERKGDVGRYSQYSGTNTLLEVEPESWGDEEMWPDRLVTIEKFHKQRDDKALKVWKNREKEGLGVAFQTQGTMGDHIIVSNYLSHLPRRGFYFSAPLKVRCGQENVNRSVWYPFWGKP